MPTYTDYKLPNQSDLSTVNTFYMGRPTPIVANRIWGTKTDAESYIADTNGSAFPGMRISVINDGDNNGLYYVKATVSSGDLVRPYSLVKLKDDYPFATSATSASTAAKIVSVDTGYFELKTGQRITVYFTNKNTANSPTLNINSTGAKNIYAFDGSSWSQITSGNNKNWLYNYVDFIYNGTYYKLVDNYYNVDQIGYSSNSDEEHSILIKKTNNTNNERGSVYFSNDSNTLATINTNTGKITTPGYILSNNGSAVTTKRVLVGDGTSVDAPTTTDTYLKATIAENEGVTTTVLGWAPVSGGSGGTVTSVKAGDGLSATNSEGTALTNDEITGSGIINLNYATSLTIGGLKLGFTNDTANRKYGLQLGKNSGESIDERAYVEVPLMGASGNNHKPGLVPDTPTTIGNNKFLRENAAWEQVSMENIYEVTSNPSSVGFLRRTSNGASTPTYSWDMATPISASSAMNSLLTYNNLNGALYYNNAITSNGAGYLYLNDAATSGDSYQLELTPNSSNPFNLKKKASGTSLYSSIANKIVLSNGLISAPTGNSGDEKYLKATIGANDAVTFSWGTVSVDTDTWRNIYVNSGSTETIGTGTNTKAINYTSGNGITISYEAAGTGTGQSGSSNYFNIKTTLKTTTSSEIGGIRLFSDTSISSSSIQTVSTDPYRTYGLQTDSDNKGAINVPWIVGEVIARDNLTDNIKYYEISRTIYSSQDYVITLDKTSEPSADTVIGIVLSNDLTSSYRLTFKFGLSGTARAAKNANNSGWYYPSGMLATKVYYFKRVSNEYVYQREEYAAAILTATDTCREIAYKPTGATTATRIIGNTSHTPLVLTAGSNVTLTATQDANNNYTGEIVIAASGGGGGSTYKFTLNGTTYGDSTSGTNLSGANSDGIFAPSGAGTANQILISGGANTAPDWGTLGIEAFSSGGGPKSSVRLNIGSSNTSWVPIKMAASDTHSGTETAISGETIINEILFFQGSNITLKKVVTGNREGLEINATGSGSVNDSTISLRGGNSTTHSTWSDNFTTNASSDKTIYVPVMRGATSGGNGDMGLVPTPASDDREKFLRGDGTWQTVSGGSTDSFKTIAVSGQSSVVADSSTDTLTLVAGTGMTITTNANTDTITFTSSVGSVEHMGVYYFVDTNYNNIYRPFEALCDLFSNIFNDGKTNDIHAYVNAFITENSSGHDGHIPLGAIILLYGMYLIQIKSSTGRFIYETNSFGSYYNYIIASQESAEMWGDSECTTNDLLTTCNIFLVTANWIGALPVDNNEYNAGTAGQSGSYLVSGGSVTIPSVGGNADTPIWHKYTFDFANVAEGVLYSDPTTLNIINNFISEIKNGNGREAETIFGSYFKENPNMSFFSNNVTEGSVPGMLVTVHHESSVAYNAQKWGV